MARMARIMLHLAPVPPTEISLGKIGQEIVLGAEVFTYPSSIAITPSITTHGPLLFVGIRMAILAQ